jgi:hypothetical protein
MVKEWIFTENEGGTLMARCLNCGDFIDPVVISNRIRSSVHFLKTRRGKLEATETYEVADSAA